MAEAVGERARLSVHGNRLQVVGVLDLRSVVGLLEAGRRAIDASSGSEAVLDLSGVRRSDSAGLALVVDWLRAARRRGLRLAIEGAPSQLMDIARVSGLEELMHGEPAVAA
jgi:phospholipid transport system transporter-binding protein